MRGWRVMLLVAALLVTARFAGAQTVTGGAFRLTSGPCTVRSGSGVPSTGLGSACDVYVRLDSPYGVYHKLDATTWVRSGPGTGATGDLYYGSSATEFGRLADVATGQVLVSGGVGAAPFYSSTPTLSTVILNGVPGMVIDATNANFRLLENDATTNNKLWVMRADGEAFAMRALDDAASTGTTFLTVDRTGTAVDNVTISPSAGDIILAPGGLDILPDTGYTKNLGALTNKFLTLHAAELWVETLVAQNTLATLGGRVLVGPTTALTADLSSGATSISVKHNNLSSGDVVLMEANGAVEFLSVTSGPSGSGPYTYSVTRNLDGTGANAWAAGDAVFNTGQAGVGGFIDLYSLASAKPARFQYIFNFNNTGSVFSSNHASDTSWQLLGDGANNETNDAVYFGAASQFFTIATLVTSAATTVSGNGAWEYWNGSAWATVSGLAGSFPVPSGAATWGAQTGWTTTTVNGVSAFWIRFRLTNSNSWTPGVWQATVQQTGQWGPTIVGNVRNSSTYNDWTARWAVGNLNGLFGYGTNVYGAAFGSEAATNLTIDATNGIRIRNGTTDKFTADTSGNLSIVGDLTVGTAGILRSGATNYSTGTGYVLDYNGGTPRLRVGTTAGNRLTWDGTNLTLVSANAVIDSTGVAITPSSTVTDARAYRFSVATGSLGLFAQEAAGGPRSVYLQSEWTGTGDMTIGPGVFLQALHTPSSGGTSTSGSISISAGSTGSVVNLTASNYVFNDSSSSSVTIGDDLRIYLNNGTTTAIPYMRSNGAYIVLEGRPTASGGGVYIGNDNNTDVHIGAGGGQNYVYHGHFTNSPPRWAAALTQSTVGAAGGASALPATPAGYIKVADASGTVFVVPVYNP